MLVLGRQHGMAQTYVSVKPHGSFSESKRDEGEEARVPNPPSRAYPQ